MQKGAFFLCLKKSGDIFTKTTTTNYKFHTSSIEKIVSIKTRYCIEMVKVSCDCIFLIILFSLTPGPSPPKSGEGCERSNNNIDQIESKRPSPFLDGEGMGMRQTSTVM